MKKLRLLLIAPLLFVRAFAADNAAPVAAAPSPALAPAAVAGQATPPAIPAANLAEAEAVLKAMHYDETLNRGLEQQKRQVAAVTRQMLMRLNAPGTSPEEYEAFQQKAVDTAWAGIKPEEIHADVARVYAELFTKDQLHDFAAFYNTPAGQAWLGKLPELQQKINAALMPRMMQIIPKIQQMAKDFAAERQALAKKTLEETTKSASGAKAPDQSAPAPAPSSSRPASPPKP